MNVKTLNKKITGVVAALLLLAGMNGCKKYADPPPVFEDDLDTTRPVQRKVLWIVMDGSVSSIMKNMELPAINALKSHAKYTYEARTEDVTTDAATWKSMASGITFTRHDISDSTFAYTPPEGSNQHEAPPSYPSFLMHILTSSRADLSASVVSPWASVNTRLFPEAEDGVVTQDDRGTKDTAVARLRNADPDILIVHFNGISLAGISGGFSASNPGYEAAVKTVDGYIGEIMAALKARPGYDQDEEWLVVVNTSHGGTGNGYGGSSPQETEAFNLYYNEKIVSQELVRGGYTGVQFRAAGAQAIKATVPENNGMYNVGATGNFSVSLKVKIAANNYYYPAIFSKRASFSPGVPGWTFFLEGNYWQINIGQVGLGNIQAAGTAISDNSWHDLAAVFETRGSNRYVRVYTDGVFNREIDITSRGNINSPAPLTLGNLTGDNVNVPLHAADIRFFNTALTNDEVMENVCLENIEEHPHYDKLIGFWPGTDGYGGKLLNRAPAVSSAALDFSLQGEYQWGGLGDAPCNIPALSSSEVSFLPTNVDVAPQLLYWLRIGVKEDWGLSGTSWLSNFEREFILL